MDLLEEATHLLRTAPAGALACYYLGAAPFVLGFLYFWIDMARSPFANRRLPGAALAMAALFLWMKFCQSIFARRLRSTMAGAPPSPLSWSQYRRIFFTQASLQPAGLFVLPLALILVASWPWAYAFFQNLTALADGEPKDTRTLLKTAVRQATFRPGQNYLLVLVLAGFSLYVFLNWGMVCFLLPGLAKFLFGVESTFSRDPFALLNTTFFAVVFGLTYLSVDPLAKAVYALRCFYGEARQSGEDLKADLKGFATPAPGVAAMSIILIGLMVVGGGGRAWAAGTPLPQVEAESQPGASTQPAASGQSPALSPPALDRAIQEVIQQDKYAWRAPREKIVELEPGTTEDGILVRFLRRVWGLLKDWLKAFFEWLGRWLQRLFGGSSTTPESSGYNWIVRLQILFYTLIVGVVAALLMLLYRAWAGRRRDRETVASQPIQPVPDLADENVGADQLPEDGWTKLARELLERGEFRLALRAFYLASLAHLAEHNLISLAKFKSNRDYERELRRRGHAFPDLLVLFGENVSMFDSVWYGLHQSDRQLVSEFAAKVERIKTGGTP